MMNKYGAVVIDKDDEGQENEEIYDNTLQMES